jgi:hypothetical protein
VHVSRGEGGGGRFRVHGRAAGEEGAGHRDRWPTAQGAGRRQRRGLFVLFFVVIYLRSLSLFDCTIIAGCVGRSVFVEQRCMRA